MDCKECMYKQGNPAKVSVAATRKRNFVLSGILERAASFSPAVHLGTGGKNRRAWNGAPNVPPPHPPPHHPAEIEGMGTQKNMGAAITKEPVASSLSPCLLVWREGRRDTTTLVC